MKADATALLGTSVNRDNLRKFILPGARYMAAQALSPVSEEDFARILELALDACVLGGAPRARDVLNREFGLLDFVWVDPFAVLAAAERERAAA